CSSAQAEGKRNSRARDRERCEPGRSADSEWKICKRVRNASAVGSWLRHGRSRGEHRLKSYEIKSRRSGLCIFALGRRLGGILHFERRRVRDQTEVTRLHRRKRGSVSSVNGVAGTDLHRKNRERTNRADSRWVRWRGKFCDSNRESAWC